MNDAAGIRWGRVVAGSFLVELVLIVVTIPIAIVAGMEAIIPFVPFACLAVGFVVSWWIVRKVESRFLLHGALIGIGATVLYLGLALVGSGSLAAVMELYGAFLFFIANGLRVLGCILGGLAARKRLASSTFAKSAR